MASVGENEEYVHHYSNWSLDLDMIDMITHQVIGLAVNMQLEDKLRKVKLKTVTKNTK